jgi:formylglycine-generating enzyme required for sulfatase activity
MHRQKGNAMRRRIALAALLLSVVCLPLDGPRAQQRAVGVVGRTPVPIVTQGGQQVGLYEESHALVIGVSDYSAGWPDLPGVKDDVRAVRDGLVQAGFAVSVVEDPTRAELDGALTRFVADRGRGENNRLLIYYAGHGHTLTPRYGGEPMGYIVPADAPDPNRDEAGFIRTAISMRRMEEYATQIQAKHALFLFDSCFSGSVFTTARAIPDAIQEKTARPVRQFITAGTAGQTVPDVSIFRPEFLKGIRGEADLNHDGYVTGSELGMFLADNVTNYSRRSQTPKYGKLMHPVLNQGDFVFQVAAKASLPPPVAAVPQPGGTFSLGDIAEAARKEEAARKAWGERLSEMNAAYQQVEALDARNVSPSIKQAGWERFLAAFTQDNPYSTEDEGLRARAGVRRTHWEGEATRLARLQQERKRKAEEEARRLAEEQGRREEEARRRQQAAIAPPSAPGQAWREPTTGMEFVPIPGGTYEQGCGSWTSDCDDDEKPTRRVTLSPFWLGRTEVTQEQWTRVMGSNPSRFQGEERPVEQVSWDDAQEFIRRLNAQSRGATFRLPTEAEWEYACRAGGKPVPYGTQGGELSPRLAKYDSRDGTVPVGRYPPNALGLHDMSGNVWEWTQDVYDGNAYLSGTVTNPVN